MTSHPLKVRFSLVRRIGGDEITFDAETVAELGQENYEYNRMMGLVRSALQDYQQNVAPTLPNSPAQSNGSNGGDWYQVDTISVTLDRGKRYVKAHTGRWSQYGIPIWPEVAKRIGWDIRSVPDTGYTPTKPLFAQVMLTDDGKPRIVALEIRE